MRMSPSVRSVVSTIAVALWAGLAPGAVAQATTGRTMNLLAPALLGQTAVFSMSYPVAATGNIYAFVWCSPSFPGVTSMTVPGFTVQGLARIDPNNFVSAFSGLLGPSGTVSHSLAIPNHPSFLGYSWDLQSIDLAIVTSSLYLADNELQLYVSGNNIPANMVPIAAGSFQMGSNEPWATPYWAYDHERPVHQVTISRPFWMGKYEVTQAEYQALMGSNPSYFQGASHPNSPNRPVETVSWNDAMAYCAALTVQEAAANRLPSGYHYRLPTEAEWEYCCRAGTTTEFNCGPHLDCTHGNFFYSLQTNTYCPCASSSCNLSPVTEPVGGYAPNAWGLHDMHGCIWEWCLDKWDSVSPYPSSSPVVDPFATTGPYRVIRGGDYSNFSYYCRSAFRNWNFQWMTSNHFGFRVVLAPVIL